MQKSDKERDDEALRLEPEEVDAALRLLRGEQQQPDEGVRLLLLELLEDLALGASLTGLSVGLATVFVDRLTGIIFLVAGFVFFVVAGIDYPSPWARSKRLLDVVGKSKGDSRRAALQAAWSKESRYLAGNISLGIAALAYVYLLYKVIADDEVSWLAIVVIGLCAVVNATDFAIDEYRKHRYYQRQLASALDTLTRDRADGGDDVTDLAVSGSIADTLEEAEERRLARAVSAAATRLDQRRDDAYAVHIASAPRDRLLELQPDIALELREAMDKLQGLPSTEAPGGARGAHTIVVAGYDVEYTIDVNTHRVDVVGITEHAGGDAP
jgi:hypothetical protein